MNSVLRIIFYLPGLLLLALWTLASTAMAPAVHMGAVKHVQSGKCLNLVLPGEGGEHNSLPDRISSWIELDDECKRQFVFNQGKILFRKFSLI